jgi:hypothetical protein
MTNQFEKWPLTVAPENNNEADLDYSQEGESEDVDLELEHQAADQMLAEKKFERLQEKHEQEFIEEIKKKSQRRS